MAVQIGYLSFRFWAFVFRNLPVLQRCVYSDEKYHETSEIDHRSRTFKKVIYKNKEYTIHIFMVEISKNMQLITIQQFVSMVTEN